jgi:hypothetical protein
MRKVSLLIIIVRNSLEMDIINLNFRPNKFI